MSKDFAGVSVAVLSAAILTDSFIDLVTSGSSSVYPPPQ